MSNSKFNQQQLEELAKLEAMSDDDVDTADIPEAPAENWMHAKREALYRPIKQPVTIRLDADILAWFKEHAEQSGYQTEINRVLRQHVTEAEKKRA
ncbi:BrnA antitoxin family protein [Agrobacterium rosae]|uniref:BrnA antitoxin family protein n=1 Tax=Agrobacterium rosae TaxID=1972867 RepID=A0A1R3TLX3_9HYPH|nr:BrnA antitoxin family protein [Agrobacterium rosae]SCX19817.1 hypothetical protein DSM25559_1900 [Agrobacterium rosae]